MSHIIRSGAAKVVSKRNISIALSQASSASAIAETIPSPSSASQSSKHTITVKDYVSFLNSSQAKLEDSLIPSSSLVSLLPNQVKFGHSIRTALQNKDVDTLRNQVSNLTAQKEFLPVIYGLNRQEISLLIKVLVEDQLSNLKKAKSLIYIIGNRHRGRLYNDLKLQAKKISQLVRYLYKSGIYLSTKDIEYILKLETTNFSYSSASFWIKEIEQTTKIHSINFQNLKLQVYNESSPLRWKINGVPINKSTIKDKVKVERPAWNILLKEFIQSLNDFVPNLTTHKELIAGFGKSGNLDQVKSHIKKTWGITLDGTSPEFTIPVTSSLYPDSEVLELIISAFNANNQIGQALSYISAFDKHYDIDMVHNTHLWRVLLNHLKIAYKDDTESLVKYFDSVWSLIEHKNVKFTTRLYEERLNILAKASRAEELLNDLPLIQQSYYHQLNTVNNYRLEHLMTNYLKVIVEDMYLQEPESDDLVTKLVKKYSFTEKQSGKILSTLDKIKSTAAQKNSKFEELQRQYDEEEEEDSLW